MFTFLHAADLHLDSPLRGLESYEGAPVEEIRGAARRALENLVDLALQQKVSFVLLGGDIYDGDWRDYNTGQFFINQVRRLSEKQIRVIMISGNHDAENKMTRSLRLPEGVTLLSSQVPQTIELPELEVAIHGQSYARSAVFEDLSASYPIARTGWINIGLLHTSVTGREGHEPYAPCTIDDLRRKGYDYWALGHIHTPEVLCRDPLIVFPGNIQGRHIRETGPKGCLLVTVSLDRTLSEEFHELDVLRWESLEIDVSEAINPSEVLDCVQRKLALCCREAAGKLLAVRIHLTGTSPAHSSLLARTNHWTEEIRSLANDIGRGDLWIEKVRFSTSPPQTRGAPVSHADGALEELSTVFREVRDNPSLLAEVGFDLSAVAKKLPDDLKDSISPEDPAWLHSILTEAEARLSYLLQGEVEAK